MPVDISSVAYHSSQPWPFPRSLMIAFTAEAVPQEAPQQPQVCMNMSRGRQGMDTVICVQDVVHGHAAKSLHTTPRPDSMADQSACKRP